MIDVYHIPCPRDPPFELPECSHKMLLFVSVYRNGSKHYSRYCRICGHCTGSIKKTDVTEEMVDAAIRLDEFWRKRWERWREDLREQWKARNRDIWFQWYNDYLASDVWAKKRRLVLSRCKRVCESCQVRKAIQVHHLTYAMVGREPLWHLRGVCVECHDFLRDYREDTVWVR